MAVGNNVLKAITKGGLVLSSHEVEDGRNRTEAKLNGAPERTGDFLCGLITRAKIVRQELRSSR